MAQVEIKVVMLGKEFSGKTSIVERFLSERYAGEHKYQATIGTAYGQRALTVNGKNVVFNVWDTAGSERFESMTRTYYREAKAAIVCYAVDDAKSWERLKFWVEEIQRMEEGCKIYICATKIDLLGGDNKKRKVDYHDTNDYCDEINAKLFETSSKDGTNIYEMFEDIAKDNLQSMPILADHDPNRISLLPEKKKSSCCDK